MWVKVNPMWILVEHGTVFANKDFYPFWMRQHKHRAGTWAKVHLLDGYRYSGPQGNREEAMQWIMRTCYKSCS